MAECPSLNELQRLLDAPAAWDEHPTVRQHIDGCSTCRDQLEKLARLDSLAPARPSEWECRARDSQALRGAIARLQGQNLIEPAPSGVWDPMLGRLLDSSEDPEFLGRLNGYLVRRVIGRGGMGLVLEGFDPVLRRAVAIKLLLPFQGSAPEARSRFLREAQAVAALVHENTVPIYAIDHVHGVPYLVLQYVAGESLAERLERRGRLPPEDVARIGLDVCRGLAAAHDAGLVHRDIKPANILLEAETGRAKLTDFGLAKPVDDTSLTVSGMLVGTPEFMPPEQISGGEADERSDLFSLGVVLYTAASGVRPFQASSLTGTLDRVRSEHPRPLSAVDPAVPPWLSDIVAGLLEKSPEDRPRSAHAVAQLLETQSAPLVRPQRSPGERMAPALPRRVRRRRLWWGAAGAATALLVLVALGWQRDARPPALSRSANFALSGSEQRFDTLEQALHAAPDGATIEVAGDGPYLNPPLRITSKRLTIRAAPGAHPVFATDFTGNVKSGAFLTSDADLRLEGLEIRWSTADPPRRIAEDLAARGAVVCSGQRATFVHCRILVGQNDACLATSSPAIELEACHLLCSQGGNGIRWRPLPGATCRVTNCALETQANLVISTGSQTPSPEEARLFVRHSTVVGAILFKLLDSGGAVQRVRLDCRDNVFNVRQVVAYYPLQSKVLPVTSEQAAELIRACAVWTENGNIYARDALYALANNRPQRAESLEVPIKDVDEWSRFWGLTDTGSVSGVIRLMVRSEGSSRPPILMRVDKPSGTPPATRGSKLEIGPGRPYQLRPKTVAPDS